MSTRITLFPPDLRTAIHWNVVQAIFQHNHVCQDCWKNTKSTFKCMIILKSRGQGQKKIENYGTNLSRTFKKNLDLVLSCLVLSWRITIHSNVDLVFFQQFWHVWLCWKIARTRFQCMVVLQSRRQNFILVQISWSQGLRVEHILCNTLFWCEGAKIFVNTADPIWVESLMDRMGIS